MTRAELVGSLSWRLLLFMREVLERNPVSKQYNDPRFNVIDRHWQKPNESEWKFITKVKDFDRIYIMSMVKYAAPAGILGDLPYVWVVEFGYCEPCFDSAD